MPYVGRMGSPGDEFLPVATVAQILRRDVRTVHRMISRGELHAVKAHSGVRAPWLVTRASVEAMLGHNLDIAS